MYRPWTESHIPCLGHCYHDLSPSFKNRVQSISLILFEVGIPNLVCRYILGIKKCHVLSLCHCDLDIDVWPSF